MKQLLIKLMWALWAVVTVTLFMYAYEFFTLAIIDYFRIHASDLPDWLRNLFSLERGGMVFRASTFCAAMILYFAAMQLVHWIPFWGTAYGRPGKIDAFFAGGILGLVMLAMNIGLCIKMDAVSFQNWHPMANWLPIFKVYLIANFFTAVAEETVFRGYILSRLQTGLGKHLAVFSSAILFGMIHLPAGELYAWAATLAGIFLGYAFIGRGIYYTIGWHYLWNVAESTFYSGKVVDYEILDPFLVGNRNIRPDQQGWLVVPILIIGTIYILIRYRKSIFCKQEA